MTIEPTEIAEKLKALREAGTLARESVIKFEDGEARAFSQGSLDAICEAIPIIEALQAEIEQLRKALIRCSYSPWRDTAKIARAALEKNDDAGGAEAQLLGLKCGDGILKGIADYLEKAAENNGGESLGNPPPRIDS